MAKRLLPENFLAYLDTIGLKELGKTLSEGEPCVSLRTNHAKNIGKNELPPGSSPIAWCENGFYLNERPKFTFDPLLHQGGYYVQEASSMFHYHIVKQLCKDGIPRRVLESCAAPGGKTTAVIDALPEGSLIVANEYVPSRAAILRENIIKWSYPASIVTRGDTAAFRKLKDSFDIIIADVPCSGEGMMRKDEEAVRQWSPGLIKECSERQREIISNLWPSLKPGGTLIYSTCTFNRYENEDMVEWIKEEYDAESVEIETDDKWNISKGIDTVSHCYRFLPDRLCGEGLFVAVIRKTGQYTESRKKDRQRIQKQRNSPSLQQTSTWLRPEILTYFDLYTEDDRINVFPSVHTDILRKIGRELDIIHEGVSVATVKGHDLIPTQSLALSPCLDKKAFPSHKLEKDEAIAYLSGENIVLPEDTPRGFILLEYNNRPLGFVKNIGKRSNNLYPAAWRIKTSVK